MGYRPQTSLLQEQPKEVVNHLCPVLVTEGASAIVREVVMVPTICRPTAIMQRKPPEILHLARALAFQSTLALTKPMRPWKKNR